MKIKSLLAGMVASAALIACTNQDIIENDNEINPSTAKAYIGIRVMDPTNGISRAATDGGFDYGTTKENAINKSLFIFYKNGEYAGTGLHEGALNVNGNPDKNTSIEANTTAVVVLQGTQGTDNYPNQVVAFLNLPDGFKGQLENQSLEKATEMVRNINEIPDYAKAGNFIMTNSVYLKEGDIQVAAPVTNENFAQTAEAAKENPITIYVERIAAKVKMTKGDNLNTPNIPITYNKQSGYNLKLHIDGWAINGVNKNTYLLKNIEATWNSFTWNWNDPTNLRSYWAKDDNYDNGVYPNNYEDYDPETSSLEYYSWNNVDNNNFEVQYCPENTENATLANNINATTYMVIAGHYSIIDASGKETEIDESNKLYKYIDQYYTENELIELLANQANIYTKEGNTETWTKVGPTDYQLVRASLSDAKLELKHEGEYYSAKDLNSKFADLAAANKKLENLGTFTTFAGGKTFFYTPIEHLNSNAGEEGHIGIVRNHTYSLTLNSIKNLGEGVFDPDEEIIITDKEKEFYVGATLNILSWKVVNQGVDL